LMSSIESAISTRKSAISNLRSGISNRKSEISNLKSEISNLRSPSRLRIFATSLLSAAAAVAITCAIFLYATRTQRQFFGSSNLQTVALTSPTQPQARGQVLWDRDHAQWRVAVFNLAPPPPGKEYELWFIPPGGKAPLPSKTFTVDENGHQSLLVQVPA